MVYVTWPRPFQGRFVILGLGLATTNLPIKFKVSTSAHYEDIKRDLKCGKWVGFTVLRGHPRSLKIAPFDRAHRFLLVFHSNYALTLHCF